MPRKLWSVVAKERPQPTEDNPRPRMKTWVMTYKTQAEAKAQYARLTKWDYQLEDIGLYETPLDWHRVESP